MATLIATATSREGCTGPITAQRGLAPASSLPIPRADQIQLLHLLSLTKLRETPVCDFFEIPAAVAADHLSPQAHATQLRGDQHGDTGLLLLATRSRFETTHYRAVGNDPTLSRGLIKLLR